MEFKFMSASEARELTDFYKDVVYGSSLDELKSIINVGISQNAQRGETSHTVYLNDEVHYAGIFDGSRTGQEEVLRDIIKELQSLGFYVEEEVDPRSLAVRCLTIYW